MASIYGEIDMNKELKQIYENTFTTLFALQEYYNAQPETEEQGLLCPNKESREIYAIRLKVVEMYYKEKQKVKDNIEI